MFFDAVALDAYNDRQDNPPITAGFLAPSGPCKVR